jgi:type II secretion system protein G
MQRPARRPATGFTLVELLVVIAIITILAAILVPTIAKTSETSKIKATLGVIRAIENACALYRSEIGNYPGAGDGVAATELTKILYRGVTLDADGDSEWEDEEMILPDGTKRDPYMYAKPEDIELVNGYYRFVDRWGSELGYDELEIPDGTKTDVTVRSHRGLDCDDPREASGGSTWGTKKVSIWSVGPDGRTTGAGGMTGNNLDNVNNWDT